VAEPPSIGLAERTEFPGPAGVLGAVDGLIDRARTLPDLERHGLQLLTVRRWRTLDRPIPPRLIAQERVARAITLAAPVALERIRSVCDGDLLLLKGPEAAAAYPDPDQRPYGDLDLLASDPPALQRALIGAGFQPVADEVLHRGHHHLAPLQVPGLPLLVEVHRAPKWPAGLAPPGTAELVAAGGPARCGIAGILGLPAAHHAIVLAAHAWAHAPLGHLRPLLDIALVAAAAAPAEMRLIAERWGASELWETTVAAINALFGAARRPAALRLWARHLPSVRERTVFERHLTSWVSPLWCHSGPEGIRAAAAAIAADLRPSPGQRWRDKLGRTRIALANAAKGASEHDESIRELGRAR
jgi:hypothetical protein